MANFEDRNRESGKREDPLDKNEPGKSGHGHEKDTDDKYPREGQSKNPSQQPGQGGSGSGSSHGNPGGKPGQGSGTRKDSEDQE